MLRGGYLLLVAAWVPWRQAAETHAGDVGGGFTGGVNYFICCKKISKPGGMVYLWWCEERQLLQVCFLTLWWTWSLAALNKHWKKPYRCFGPVPCPLVSVCHNKRMLGWPSAPYASDGTNISPFQHISGGNEWAWRECWQWRRRERWRRRSGPIQEQKEWKFG